MELKTFVKSTIQSIIEASQEIIEENQGKPVFYNPVSNKPTSDDCQLYWGKFIPVTEIKFDVAVAEGTEKSGGGGASIDVISIKVGGNGQIASTATSESRISFSLRVALPAWISSEDKGSTR
ncbi:MAG: hypothetical protein ACKVKF_02695 [Rhodobacterales bacterium]|uniref:hypothetical protein n=1 Tax=Puniceibacterium antarcticum TaxID=1206336 RepID=UPI001179FE09|nr:hypothetical protein [Puniceibacterium antarcticum]